MNQNNKKKYALIYASLVVGIIVLYGAAAFAFHFWPFSVQTKTESSNTKKSAKISMQKPTINPTTKVLYASTTIDTKEQGKCTITLTSESNRYVLQNSTENIEGKTGCLEWNIGTGSIPPGDYDVKIDFVGKTQTSSIKSNVTIP